MKTIEIGKEISDKSLLWDGKTPPLERNEEAHINKEIHEVTGTCLDIAKKRKRKLTSFLGEY